MLSNKGKKDRERVPGMVQGIKGGHKRRGEERGGEGREGSKRGTEVGWLGII